MESQAAEEAEGIQEQGAKGSPGFSQAFGCRVSGASASPRGTVLLANSSKHLSRLPTLAYPTSISRTNFCRLTAAALSTHPLKSSTGGRTRARR